MNTTLHRPGHRLGVGSLCSPTRDGPSQYEQRWTVTKLRIATWNLERPSARSWKRLPAQRQRMADVAADVWVLTETRASVSPGDGYHGVHTPPHPTRRPDPDERWVSIWSRWPLTPIPEVAANPRGSVAARCDTPAGPVLVYGTVLAWANEPDEHGTVRMWQQHLAEIARQGAEWQLLADTYPDHLLIVAGDYNQDRDGSGWYGTHATRAALTEQLDAARLQLLTATDVVADGLLDQHLIDHIAIGSRDDVDADLHCWPARTDQVRLSDHPTVAIDLTLHQTPATTTGSEETVG